MGDKHLLLLYLNLTQALFLAYRFQFPLSVELKYISPSKQFQHQLDHLEILEKLFYHQEIELSCDTNTNRHNSNFYIKLIFFTCSSLIKQSIVAILSLLNYSYFPSSIYIICRTFIGKIAGPPVYHQTKRWKKNPSLDIVGPGRI